MKIPHLRWIIVGLVAAVTVLNYIDRVSLSVVSVEVLREFHMNAQDYSIILALFLLGWAVMCTGSGYVMDRFGTRWAFAFFIAGWSIAQMLHSLTTGIFSLGACRLFLGACEPAWSPAGAKIVKEWLKPSQRALGIGIINTGGAMGSMLAPPLVAFAALRYGWRAAFVVTGALGLVWVLVWLIVYQVPRKNRFLGESERDEILKDTKVADPAVPTARVGGLQIFKRRGCWSLVLLRFLTDPIVFFVAFWLPQYLRTQRGFDLAAVGKYAFLPFVFAGVGSLFGGWLSGRFIRAGWELPRARKLVMSIAAVLGPVAIFAPLTRAPWMAIAATCSVIFGQAIWAANLMSLPVDLFRSNEVGTVVGFAGTGGALGGLLAQFGTGYAVTHFAHGYTSVFTFAGISLPLSLVLLYVLLPRREFLLGEERASGIRATA